MESFITISPPSYCDSERMTIQQDKICGRNTKSLNPFGHPGMTAAQAGNLGEQLMGDVSELLEKQTQEGCVEEECI